jgi:hypothetical protein
MLASDYKKPIPRIMETAMHRIRSHRLLILPLSLLLLFWALPGLAAGPAQAAPPAWVDKPILAQSGPVSKELLQKASKTVLVLGIKERRKDFRWDSPPFEAAVRVIKQRMSQAQYMVLDEGAIEGYKGVIDKLKVGDLNKAALLDVAKAARADWLVLVSMNGQKQKLSASNPFNQVKLHLRMELIEVNLNRALASSQQRAQKMLHMDNPRRADWNEAMTKASVEAAQKGADEIAGTNLI